MLQMLQRRLWFPQLCAASGAPERSARILGVARRLKYDACMKGWAIVSCLALHNDAWPLVGIGVAALVALCVRRRGFRIALVVLCAAVGAAAETTLALTPTPTPASCATASPPGCPPGWFSHCRDPQNRCEPGCACVTVPPTATFPPTATAPPSPPRCTGDCDLNQVVTIDELVSLVNIALDRLHPSQCPILLAAPRVEYLVQAVGRASAGCPGGSLPTETPIPSEPLSYRLLQGSTLIYLSRTRTPAPEPEDITGAFSVLTERPDPNEFFRFTVVDLTFNGANGTTVIANSGEVNATTFNVPLAFMSTSAMVNGLPVYLQGVGPFVGLDPPTFNQLELCAPDTCESIRAGLVDGYIVTLFAATRVPLGSGRHDGAELTDPHAD